MDEEMSCFGILAAGMTFDLTDFPDMPEEVRAYLMEMHRQIAEDGAEGVTAIGEDHVPEFVTAWLKKAIAARIGEFKADEDSMRVREYPVWRAAALMDNVIKKKHKQFAERTAKTAEARAELNRMEIYMRTLVRALYKNDPDWRELGLRQADRLFQGVMLGMLKMAAEGVIMHMGELDEHAQDRILGEVTRKMAMPEGGDDDDKA